MKFLKLNLLAALAVLAGCSQDDRTLAPDLSRALTVGLEVSSATAARDEQIAVAVRAESRLSEPLQGLQGYLRFDATRLAYVGQADNSNSLVMVNDQAADRGELRLLSVEPAGLDARTAVLVFRVVDPAYLRGLSYRFEEAASLHYDITHADEAAVRPAADLAVVSAARISAAQWSARLEPQAGGLHVLPTPGQYAPNLKYGDANVNGTITVGDVVYLSNISVGNLSLLDNGIRDAVIAGNVRPVNGGTGGTPRPGVEPGTANPDGQITVGDVVAVSNASVGTSVAVVGDIIPGRGPTPFPSTRVVINSDITADRTLHKDTVYQIGDAAVANVHVTNGAVLTIEPGTRLEGWYGTGVFGSGGVGQGQGVLYVSRDGRLIADGTALEPIVFTCALPPFVGPRGEPANTRWPGCWGGLFINGNSTINSDSPTSSISPVVAGRSAGGCIQEQDEADATAFYGGCNDADSSGVLRYVRSEYAGARFSSVKERNGITFNGVGSHTLVDFIQVHASLDDGTEYFGGTVNVKHLVLTANEDDNFDFVLGYRGSAQFILVQADSVDGDRCLEMDNNGIDAGNPDATPRSSPTIFNVTCVGKAQPFRYTAVAGLPTTCHTQLGATGSASANCVNQAFLFRQNTSGIVRNVIAYRYGVGLDIDQPSGAAGGGPTLSPFGICDAVAAGMLRNAVISLGPTAPVPPGAAGGLSVAADQDATDPGVSGGTPSACGPYGTPAFTGSNLEALYEADAGNNVTVFGNDNVSGDYLVNPLDVLAPDFRPKAGSAPTTLAAAPNPGTVNGFTFDNAPYLGAVAPANGTGSNIPWYAGWTRGWTSSTTK
jgi:hypothetical protein